MLCTMQTALNTLLNHKYRIMFSYNTVKMEETSIVINLSIEQKENLLVAHLLFFNNSPNKYYLDKYTICYNAEFTRDVFRIFDEQYGKADYVGPMVKRKIKPEDFISLESGESVKTRVILNNGYKLRRGRNYNIQYSVYNLDYLKVQAIMLIESNKVEVVYQ